ncbi:MAG: hypothetical protein C0483_26155 [Pirellula sp.]|nr:hypothetical protein [Pirellula sp.]
MDCARRRGRLFGCSFFVVKAALCLLTTLGLPIAAALAQEPVDGAKQAAATDDVLGFSRYLPADTNGYVSLLQAGNVRKVVADSQAWSKLEEVPEVHAALEQARAQWKSELPMPVRAAADLAAAMFATEATFAATPETSRQLVHFVRVVLLAIPTFAPSQLPPGSAEEEALEQLRGPMRTDWLSAVQDVRVPPLVFAWRLPEIGNYRGFIDSMISLAWVGASAEIEKAPPPMRDALKKIYTQTKVGNAPTHRFRLRVGDVVPPMQIEQALHDAQLSATERRVLAHAVADLSIEIHLAYVGDYLTLVVGPDDSFIRQIVDRFEGRSAETLAASRAFAPLRGDLRPESLLVLYSDGEQAQRELLRVLLPLIDQLSHPKLWEAFGAPPTVSAQIQSLKGQLVNAAAASPIRQEAVILLEAGVKQTARMEYELSSAPAVGPLTVPKFVPAGAVAYSAYRYVNLAGVGQQAKGALEQQLAEFAEQRERYAGQPETLEFIDRRAAPMNDLLDLIDGKLAKLAGEVGLVLGPFAKFSMEAPGGPKMENLAVPTLALGIGTADSEQTFQTLTATVQTVMELITSNSGQPSLSLVEQEVDGIAVQGLAPGLLPMQGFEPHLARVGDFVFFSTSHALTKQLRDAQAGKTPDVTTAAAYQAKQEYFPAKAAQLTFINGDTLHAELKSAADAIFAYIQANEEALHIRSDELAQIEQAKRLVATSLELLRCFRAAASGIVVDGSTHNLREWIHLEDLAR